MGFWGTIGSVARVMFPVHYLANKKYLDMLFPPDAPGAADMRGQYQPRSATYGTVLPTVYGTTLIPALTYCRGRLEVKDETWKQHQLALGLCQGPVSAIQAIWMSDGTEADVTKSGRILWSRAQACGFSLQPGNLTGNLPIAPGFRTSWMPPPATADMKAWYASGVGHLVLVPGSTRTFLPAFANVTVIRLPDVLHLKASYARGMAATEKVINAGDYTVISVTDTEIQVTVTGAFGGSGEANAVTLDGSPWEITPIAGGVLYPGIGYLRGAPVDLAALYKPLGETASLTPEFWAETTGGLVSAASGPAGLDAEAADVIADIIGPNYWSANINVPAETEIGAGGDVNSGFRRYCRASGFYVSGALREQRPAADHLQSVLDATDAAVLCNEGKIKILPLGDEPLTLGAYTYTPSTAPVYDLTRSDGLLGDERTPAVSMTPLTDGSINVVPVEYRNRDAAGASYRISVETAYDGADIERQAALYGGTGKREAPPSVLHWIVNPGHARRIAQLRLQRARAVRNAQRFQAGWRFARLEPMDLVTLTDAKHGLDHVPVRITAIEEDESGTITVESVDWPIGMAGATTFKTGSSDAGPPRLTDDPGVVLDPQVLVVPAYIAGADPQIWIAANGPAEGYGGCDVYVSDGTAYRLLGTIRGRSTIGYLTAALAAGSDPDAVNTIAVNLSESLGALAGTTAAGRDAYETLAAVQDELVSFQAVAAGATPYAYTLSSLRRGAYESAIVSHPVDARFVRLDGNVLRVPLPASFFGVPINFKFIPFNRYGSGRPAFADVAAVSFTLPLSSAKAPSACAIAVSSSAPAVVANQWRATAQENLHLRWANVTWTPGSQLAAGFDVVIHTGTEPDDASTYVVPMVQVGPTITSAVVAVSAGASALTVRAAVRARFSNGPVSAWRASSGTATIDANTSAPAGSGAEALILAGSKTAVFHQNAAPTNPQSGYTLRAGDLWYSTDTATVCPDLTCKGHAADAAGAPLVGSYAHRGIYWAHRWTGTAWASVETQALIISSEIAAGAIVADKIAAGTITTGHLVVPSSSGSITPDPLASDPSAWAAHSGTIQFVGVSDLSAGATALQNPAGQASFPFTGPLIPIDTAKRYRVEVSVKQQVGTAATAYLAVAWYNASGALIDASTAAPAGWLANGTFSYYGLANQVVPTTWTTYGIGFGSGEAAAIPSSARFVRIGALLNYNATAGAVVRMSNVRLWQKTDATLIVDGAIQASKMAADAIRTSNFTSTGSGTSEVASLGAKMQADGTALVVAPGGLKVGTRDMGTLGYVFALLNVQVNNRTVFNSKNASVTRALAFESTYGLKVEVTDNGLGSGYAGAATFTLDAPLYGGVPLTPVLYETTYQVAGGVYTTFYTITFWNGSAWVDPNSLSASAALHVIVASPY